VESHSGLRRLRLEDFYSVAETIQLHEGVPETVRNQFQVARNLIVYSWYYYPFNVTAELCAYIAVEHALRIKAGKTDGSSTFRRLLKGAVERGWIRDEGFSHLKRLRERIRLYNEGLPPEFQLQTTPQAEEYCKAMTQAMPNLRNALAHGETYLHHSGAMTVRICAELANQLFEKPKAMKSK
jgi:hypothetical protein